ncbi:PD40 domain-containing protein [bacterium]|nr:PD40 domain-containing protein [bacterium]
MKKLAFILAFTSLQTTFAQETHLKNIKQLTFGGENAEAYLNEDGTKLIFQSTHGDFACDQIFTMNIDGTNKKLVSTGKGRTTCAYYVYGTNKIIFSSTHQKDEKCPEPVMFAQGKYVWHINPNYDIFVSDTNGEDLKPLASSKYYDAEATISTDGKKIIFTSTRDGDLELYKMNTDGTNVKRLTNTVGYDGGAFFSDDGTKIIYRAYHPKTEEEIKIYQDLLAQDLVQPSKMDLWIMNSDGSEQKQITNFGAASFAPFMHPDGKRVIFCSNLHSQKEGGRNFDLFIINLDGTGLEQITDNETFDGFPMFTRDGKKLVFASNRNNAKKGDTNIFIADFE